MGIIIATIVIYFMIFGLTYTSAIIFALIALLYYGLNYLFNKEEREKREKEKEELRELQDKWKKNTEELNEYLNNKK